MLYIIATPIGNLGDVSLRAVETIGKLDILLCEDTRQTIRLLEGLKIANRPQLVSYYDEVEEQRIPQVLEWLRKGKEVGLVSDGGTPLLSDPGWKLVKRCQEKGIKYTSLPGACAAINALVLAGLPMGRWSFLGFLPKRNGERLSVLKEYAKVSGTKVIYESPMRVARLIDEIKQVYGETVKIRIIREMTKKYEEVKTDSDGKNRGEVVVVFG